MSYDKGVTNDYLNQIFLLKKTISILFNFITLPIAIPMIIVRKIYLWRYENMKTYYSAEPDTWISYWIEHEIYIILSFLLYFPIFLFVIYLLIPLDWSLYIYEVLV